MENELKLKLKKWQNGVRIGAQSLKEQPQSKSLIFDVDLTQGFEMELLLKGDRDLMPVQAHTYVVLNESVRLQSAPPIFLQRLTPLSICNMDLSQLNEVKNMIIKVRDPLKVQQQLPNQHKMFFDYLIESKQLNCIYQMSELSGIFGSCFDAVREAYLQRIQPLGYGFQVKFQFKRFQQYFCHICNLFVCSLHFIGYSQRLFTEREPTTSVNPLLDDPNFDDYYTTSFMPTKDALAKYSKAYKQKNGMELSVKCNSCVMSGVSLKKFQKKAIEALLEIGFTKSCFIRRVLQNTIQCGDIEKYIRSYAPVVRKSKKIKQRKTEPSTSTQHKLYQPCYHEGDCSEECDCLQCHRWCSCGGKCSNAYKGCQCDNCGYDDKKKRINCPCRANSQECDPAVCQCKSCTNNSLQKGIKTKLVLSKSLICSGLGLFAAQDFKTSEFIGEYIGNYIRNEDESHSIELVDQLTNNHYLFELDDYWQVDGTKYGNKLRFINHCSSLVSVTNCQPSVLFSQGRWRIGIFANKNISLGEELYFDYGDKFKTDWLIEFTKKIKTSY